MIVHRPLGASFIRHSVVRLYNFFTRPLRHAASYLLCAAGTAGSRFENFVILVPTTQRVEEEEDSCLPSWTRECKRAGLGRHDSGGASRRPRGSRTRKGEPDVNSSTGMVHAYGQLFLQGAGDVWLRVKSALREFESDSSCGLAAADSWC